MWEIFQITQIMINFAFVLNFMRPNQKNTCVYQKKHIQYEFKTNQLAATLDNNLLGVVVQSVTQKEITKTHIYL